MDPDTGKGTGSLASPIGGVWKQGTLLLGHGMQGSRGKLQGSHEHGIRFR